MRRRLARKVGLAFAALFLLVFAASALAVTLLSGAFGLGSEREGLILPAAILGLVLLIVGAALITRMARRVVAPVADVMDAAARIAGGDYAARVEARGPREMRRLAGSFNSMAERLAGNEQQRRSLLADVAHELRTPLSVIRGNLEGLVDGLYPPDEEHLRPVLEETALMTRLLDDLQTLSMAEAGALQLHREPVSPAGLIEDATNAFRARAEEAGVALESRVEPGLPTMIDVDPVRIAQVLANLLSNAVRHTPGGGSVAVTTAPLADGSCVFTVVNTGPSIPAEDLPYIFDRFVKSADSGGAGLGLAIARSLVEAHGGTITASSEAGEGTTISFVL